MDCPLLSLCWDEARRCESSFLYVTLYVENYQPFLQGYIDLVIYLIFFFGEKSFSEGPERHFLSIFSSRAEDRMTDVISPALFLSFAVWRPCLMQSSSYYVSIVAMVPGPLFFPVFFFFFFSHLDSLGLM